MTMLEISNPQAQLESERMAASADTPAVAAEGANSGRDERLDLLRGLCVLKMVHSHGAWTVLHPAIAAIGPASAAEGFFLLSGVVLGVVGRRRTEQGRWRDFAIKLWRRASWLLMANVALAAAFGLWDLLGRDYGFFHFGFTYKWMFSPANGGWQWFDVFSFDYPYFLYILPRYVVFLLAAPLALAAMARWGSRGAWGVLLASVGLWVVEHAPGVELKLPWFEFGLTYGFRLSAWQMPFFVGLVIGFNRTQLAPLWRGLTRPGALVMLLAVAIACAAAQAVTQTWPLITLPTSLNFKLFDHDQLGLMHVIDSAALFPLIFWLTVRFWQPISASLGPILLPMGRHALPAFLLHIPLVYAVRAVLEVQGWHSLLATHLANAALLLMVILFARWLAARAQGQRRKPQPHGEKVSIPPRRDSVKATAEQ